MSDPTRNTTSPQKEKAQEDVRQTVTPPVQQPQGEIGGMTDGQEPTIFGDWQHAGRCSDF